MIRFSCPGCQKTLSVPDEKAGKTGKCPQCMTAFVIPDAPAAPDNSTVEIAPCPKCAMALTVTSDTLGAEVECPGCKTIFTAAKKTEATPKPSSRVVTESSTTRKKAVVEDEDEDERPSRRKRRLAEEDEEDERPSKRRSSRRDDDEDEDDRPSRRKPRDEEDDEEDDRPRKKKKKFRKSGGNYPGESKRVTAAILAWLVGWLGIHKFYLGYSSAGTIMLLLGIFTCGLATSIIGVIEAIIYITKTNEEFYDTYERGTKEWF
jgi:TM2 domain-containing membrane protein YozV/phage FluMu protein Com